MSIVTTQDKQQALTFEQLINFSSNLVENSSQTFFLLEGGITKEQLDFTSHSLEVELSIIRSGDLRYLHIGTTGAGISVESVQKLLKGNDAQLFLHTHSTTKGIFMPVPSFQDIRCFKPCHGLHVVAVDGKYFSFARSGTFNDFSNVVAPWLVENAFKLGIDLDAIAMRDGYGSMDAEGRAWMALYGLTHADEVLITTEFFKAHPEYIQSIDWVMLNSYLNVDS